MFADQVVCEVLMNQNGRTAMKDSVYFLSRLLVRRKAFESDIFTFP